MDNPFVTNRSILQTERASNIMQSVRNATCSKEDFYEIKSGIQDYCNSVFSDVSNFADILDAFTAEEDSRRPIDKIKEMEVGFLNATKCVFDPELRVAAARESHLELVVENPNISQFFQYVLFNKASPLAIENSLIVVPDCRSLGIEHVSSDLGFLTPYVALKSAIIKGIRDSGGNDQYFRSMSFALRNAESSFCIGHDSSWVVKECKDSPSRAPDPNRQDASSHERLGGGSAAKTM